MKKNLLTIVLVFSVAFCVHAQKKAINRFTPQKTVNQLGSRSVNSNRGPVSSSYHFIGSATNQNNTASLSEGFEDATFPPEGWTVINGGDAETWIVSTNSPHTGHACAAISYSETAHADYLVTPKLSVTAGNNTLSAWFKSESATTFPEPYTVMVSTTGTAAGDFILLKAEPTPGTDWEIRSYNLSAYNGQNIYVAFRSTTTYMWRLYIDDVTGPDLFKLSDDAGVKSIQVPSNAIPGVIIPKAVVKNYGLTTQDFRVRMSINNGTSDIYSESLNITALAPDATLQLIFTDWTAVPGLYTINVHVTNADDMNTANDTKESKCTVEILESAYAGNASDSIYNSVNLATGITIQKGIFETEPFAMAEEFNGTSIYRLNDDFSIGTVGANGKFAKLGTLLGAEGTPTGLAYNWKTNTWYVMVISDLFIPQLFTLDLNTLQLSFVGNGTEAMIIGMDFAWDGFLYGPAVDTDSLYKINSATGTIKAIGPLGIDINYGQDVSFDGQTGKLYTFTSGDESSFGTYDILTGAFTEILNTGQIQVATIVITKKPLDSYNTTFTVRDGTTPVEGAKVSFNAASILTDASGKATFASINGTYAYSVTKFRYGVATGSVIVAGSNKDVAVNLTALPGFNAVFTVSNKIPVVLAGASIVVTQGTTTLSGLTNASGVYAFNTMPAGSYNYSISLNGYKTKTGVFTIVASNLPIAVSLDENMVLPYGLAITNDGKDATFTWNNETGFSDDFESYPDFTLKFSPWILNDVDGSDTYEFNGITFANSGLPMAGIIFNPTATTPALKVKAHSGKKCIAIFDASVNFPNDDWIIAPKAKIEPGQQVSFFAKAYDPDYVAEKFRVFVSTSGTEPADFIPLSPLVTCADTAWHQYTYSLSDYDGKEVYVAIHCTSEDQFILWIDDFSIKHAVKKAFTGYNVYLDNMTTPVARNISATTYKFIAPTIASHVAGVSSVYTTGESAIVKLPWVMGNVGINPHESVRATIFPNPTNGKINIENLTSANIYITNVLGSIVALKENISGATSFDLSQMANGIYTVKIVSGKKSTTQKISLLK